MTLSPGLKDVTELPVSTTTPAPSDPGTKGSLMGVEALGCQSRSLALAHSDIGVVDSYLGRNTFPAPYTISLVRRLLMVTTFQDHQPSTCISPES